MTVADRDGTRLPDQYDHGFAAGRKFELERQIALTLDRDWLGRMVRHAWVEWAKTQDAPKAHWLLPYDELSEPDKEADRQIGEYLIEWAKKYAPATLANPGDEVLFRQLREMATEFAVDNNTDCKQHVCWIAADRLSRSGGTAQGQPGCGEPVAWFAEYDGHLDTTIYRDTMERWKALGRKITPLFPAPPPLDPAGQIDRGELVAMLQDLASVNLSREAKERQAARMADALIAKGIGGAAYTAQHQRTAED
jgi:hypothetical protein